MNYFTTRKSKDFTTTHLLAIMLTMAALFIFMPEMASAATSLVTGADKIGKEVQSIGKYVIVIGLGIGGISIILGQQAGSKIAINCIFGGAIVFGAGSIASFLETAFKHG